MTWLTLLKIRGTRLFRTKGKLRISKNSSKYQSRKKTAMPRVEPGLARATMVAERTTTRRTRVRRARAKAMAKASRTPAKARIRVARARNAKAKAKHRKERKAMGTANPVAKQRVAKPGKTARTIAGKNGDEVLFRPCQRLQHARYPTDAESGRRLRLVLVDPGSKNFNARIFG